MRTNHGPDGRLPEGLTEQEVLMKKAVDRYVVSFQSEPFHKGRRYHWMICWEQISRRVVVLGTCPYPGTG